MDVLLLQYPQHVLTIIFGLSLFTATYIGSFVLIKKMRNRSSKNSQMWHLTDADIALISNKTTSTFHAVLCFTSGLIIIQNTIHAMKDSRYWLTETYAMIAWSYFTYDTFSMFHGYLLNNHEIKATITKKFLLFAESKGLLFIHHVFLAVGIISLLVSRREMGDFVAGCFYMMELSTPFLHARYLLIKQLMLLQYFTEIVIHEASAKYPSLSLMNDHGHSFSIQCGTFVLQVLPYMHRFLQLQMNKCRLYTVNGVFIFLTFFSCRILVFPVMYHIYGVQNNLPSIMATVTTIPYMCNVFILMCFIPQCYWFYIICKIMVLTFLKGNSYQKNSKKAN